MDYTKAIEIAKNIYWVGKFLENDPFQCHPYFIKNGDESILIDPGSMLELEAVTSKTKSLIDLKNIKYIILHHQDPDICASIPEIEKVIGRSDLQIITHSRMIVLIKHYMITSDYYEIDKNDFKLTTQNGLTLDFITTPYCHSPGAFVSYDPQTKVLFSSDIFAGLDESWDFYAKDDYFSQAKAFHSTYMPSKDIFNYSLRKIEKLDINLIAPQHGSIIERRFIYNLIEDMKNLECGLYIDKKYNNELIDTIEELKKKDKELKSYKNLLEKKVKEKTYVLEDLNEKLKSEHSRLNKFNQYLSELNSVDVSFLANSGIKHILNIVQAQIGILYISENKQDLKILAKHSVDKKLLKSDFFNNSSGEGIVSHAYKNGKWVYIDGLNEELAPTIDLGFYQTKLKNIVAIPLIFHKSKIGVVLIGSVSNIRFNDGYLKGYINTLVQSLNNAMTFIDTQRYSLELKNINIKLEETNRLKSEFLANMSHELRTPLNSIIGFSNILQKNKQKNLIEKQLIQLEKINRNGIHLLELINSILDLSKIESGKMDIELRDIDIISSINLVIELLVFQAENSAKKLTFKNSLNTPTYLYKTDEHKLKQVIINLIGNAIKFVPIGEGTVVVEVKVDGGILKISVTDNGIGIAKEKLKTIFDAFTQSDGSTTRKYGGTGLGLTISKNIVELLGGYIDVDSKLGRGSTFTICLPIGKKSLEKKSKNDDKLVKIFFKNIIESVLIIDDSSDSQDLLKEYFENNYSIYSALSGKEGIEIAKKYKPSLITLDIMMGELDGWEVLKRLKLDEETQNIPIILISNVVDKNKAKRLGAIDALSKPISKDDLVKILDKYFIDIEGKG